MLKRKEIGKGRTRPLRLILSDGVMTRDALSQTIEKRATTAQFLTGGGELYFADSYHFNIAACRIAVLLGIDGMIPVTEEREWRSRQGSLSSWIDAKWEIDDLMARRDLILAHFEKLIAEKGESQVLY